MLQEFFREHGAQFFIMYASSKNPNFYYATKFKVPDPVFYMIGDDGTELLVVPEMERRRAERESRVREIASLNDLGFHERLKETGDAKRALAETYADLIKTHHGRKILVPEDFPAFLYHMFVERFDIQVVENPYSIMRSVKTPEEIKSIKETSDAIIQSFRFFLKILKKERNSEKLRNEVEAFLYSKGFVAEDTIISGDSESSDPHCIGHGSIRSHVIFDVFPRSRKTGYHSDFTRTVMIQESPDIREMLDACIEAKNRTIEMIRDGVSGEDIHFLVCDVLESRGYKTLRQKAKEGFIHSTGHGVGLEVHEKPKIYERGEELKAGMVITVEPGLYYEKIGGVRVEDTVVVRKNGCEILTKFDDVVRLV